MTERRGDSRSSVATPPSRILAGLFFPTARASAPSAATTIVVVAAIVVSSATPAAAFAVVGPTATPSFAGGLRPAPLRPWWSSWSSASAAADDVEAEASPSPSDVDPTPQSSSSSSLAKRALLVSSFADGVASSPGALNFLKYGLASSLAESIVREREDDVRESVLFSPCAGPDIDALNKLEEADEAAKGSKCGGADDEDDDGGGDRDYGAMADGILDRLVALRDSDSDSDDDQSAEPLRCRVLYIPTAMYALNPNSNNTPGKQRQRARADGKKRRNVVVEIVNDLLNGDEGGGGNNPERETRGAEVLAVTLDLSDGSVKQPAICSGSGSGSGSGHAPPSSSDDDASSGLFPSDGREALTSWNPHLIYVEGGNTFWLTHCLEEGRWGDDLRGAVCGDGAAMYVGKSAGAILAGERVETATWKGWDDPSVVDSRPTYDDWTDHPGLSLAGPRTSFFPHMNDDWIELVEEKRTTMEEREGTTTGGDDESGAAGDEKKGAAGGRVLCLRENEACCVDGDRGEVFLVEGQTVAAEDG